MMDSIAASIIAVGAVLWGWAMFDASRTIIQQLDTIVRLLPERIRSMTDTGNLRGRHTHSTRYKRWPQCGKLFNR